MVQWLRLRTSKAGAPGSVPGQGTRSHMLQLRVVHMPQLKQSSMLQLRIPVLQVKTLHSTSKTRCSQINKQTNFKMLKENCQPQNSITSENKYYQIKLENL